MGYALPPSFAVPGQQPPAPTPPAPQPPAPQPPAPQPPAPQAYTPQPPPPQYGAPPQPPQYGAPPQPPQYGAPPQPPQYGAPPQPPAPYGAPPAYGAPPQTPAAAAPTQYAQPAPQMPPPYGQPQPQPQQPYQPQPQQPYQPQQQQPYQPQPQQPYQPQYQPQPQPSPYGQPGFGPSQPAATPFGNVNLPTSAPGTLFGIPFSIMKDADFLKKVLSISAVLLIVSRFIPVGKSYGLMWTWSSGAFRNFIWPIIVAAVYGGVAFLNFLPPNVREKIPQPVLKWGPFVVAYYTTGWTYAAVPFVATGVMLGMPTGGVGAVAGLAWAYPLLVFGMLVRIQDPDDMIARVFVALGALASLGSFLSMLSEIFRFSGTPFLFIIHNFIMLLVILVAAACILFAIPNKWLPFVERVEPFAPMATAILIVWLPISAVLIGLATTLQGSIINLFFVLPHLLIMQVAYVGVLLLTAPATFDVLKGYLGKFGVQTSAAAYTGGPAAAPPQGMTIEQRLAQLDVDWSRGGMTPEEYTRRRNAILMGQ